MRDIAFVPQRDVFQRGQGIGADHARLAGKVLGQDRVALVRHRARPLLAGREILFRLEHFGALEMADFDRQPFDRTGDDRQRRKEHGVPVARDDLRRDGLHGQAELVGDMLFHLRVDVGESADCTRYGTGRDFRARRDQAGLAAVELGIGLRQLEPEGHRFGMDAMAAPDGGRVFVFLGAALDRLEQAVEISQQDIGRACQLDRQRRVEHVAAGHALVHEARFVADILGHPGKEGDDIVLGDRLNRIDRLDVDLGIGCPPVPQRLGRRGRDHAQFAQLLGRMRFNLEPDFEAGFRFPESGHCGAGVARDHGRILHRKGKVPRA